MPIDSISIITPNSRVTSLGAGLKNQEPDFATTLAGALAEVNRLQLESEEANRQLAAGQIEDLSQVVLAAEKAEIALQLTLQIRNKILEAYQEMMRMQV